MGDSVEGPAPSGLVPPVAAAAGTAAGAPAAAGRTGRRLALSVVLDGRLDAGRASEVARLVARLGLDGVWWREPPLTGTGSPEPAALLRLLQDVVAPARTGLILDSGGDSSGDSGRAGPALAGRADPGRADPGLAGPDLGSAGAGPRLALTGSIARLAAGRPALAAQLSRTASEIALPAAAIDVRLATTAPRAILVPFSPGRDLGAAVGAAAAAAAGRPVLVEVSVSVGRTTAEAHARADREELFAVVGHPATDGLFGTLEEGQAGAARLSHAGATELVCYLPHSGDLPDVLAQLRAMAVGAEVLRHGEPPSSPPPPPAGWGGRRPVA